MSAGYFLVTHFQIFSDGTKRRRLSRQLHAEQPAERETGRRKTRQHAEQPVGRETSSLQHRGRASAGTGTPRTRRGVCND